MKIKTMTAAAALLLCIASQAQTFLQPQELPAPADIPFAGPDTVSVALIGDVMMHSRQLEYDFTTFLENIKAPLQAATFAVANMEFPLAGEPYTGYPSFSTPEPYADYVADCGVDVFLMANNHLLDRREKGLERTLQYYRVMSDRVSFTGAASDPEEMERLNPLMLITRTMRIALVNFTCCTNNAPAADWPSLCYDDKDQIQKAIRSAKAQGADFIIALPHWGIEYDLHHSRPQAELAGWLVAQGVNAVVGAHPHVVQDTTHIGGAPVIYSMGNAVSNMSAINTRLELEVTLRFVRDRGGKRMLEPQLRFMWCTLPDTLTDSYSTIYVDEWIGRRDCWKDPSDYDNMISTLHRVKAATGIR